jgi:DNA replication protein DnaC
MNRDIHNIIAREYERRQKVSADLAQQRKAELYAKIPRLLEIDNQISFMGLKYNRLILTSNGSASELLSELEQTLKALSDEKNSILAANNISPEFFKPRYECEKCSDTGYITGTSGSQRCSCYKQQIINHLFAISNISLNGNESFENFDEELYPEETDQERYGIAVSPRENIISIKRTCLEFTRNIDNPDYKNLFFSGRTGVGKTFLSLCIARELLNQGRTVLYVTAPVLFDIITEHKMMAYREDNYNDDKYQSIFNVELLIIDDLGTETLSDARYAELLNILNTRQANNGVTPCKTIISTNLGPKKLIDLYTERITSRIMGHFDRLVLAGRDIRSLNA